MMKNSIPNNLDVNSAIPRRKFIKMIASGLAVLSLPTTSIHVLAANNNKRPKIVWVLLRGALDSLHTIVPTSDEEYKSLRPKLSKSFSAPLLPLDKGFALHPALKNMHQWYQDKQLLPIVAVSSGYERRSHFDGQDFLESGLGEIDFDSGWLGRAIEQKNKRALAVARSTPISLRNSDQVNTWYPSNLKNADDDIYSALAKLYKNDEQLGDALSKGLEVRGMVANNKSKAQKQKGNFVSLTKACAKLMVGEQGVDCAMLELGGWDTHNNQGSRLQKKLSELDTGLDQLKLGLADEWKNTVVVIATEFGRTAKENGTGGTDHGTGSALFLAGGAIKGGEVQGTWPGLKPDTLFEQRDLMPTSNTFAWIGNVLSKHWGLSEQELKQVFPHINAYNEPLLRR
jgi:uncharacterized protein (DUF1501 family)